MANKVTATINLTNSIIRVYNLETSEIADIGFNLYGECTKEVIKRTAFKHFNGALEGWKANNLQFLKVVDFTTSSELREMDIEAFIAIGKVLTDEDTKIGKITRTINKLLCAVKAVDNETEEFETVNIIIDNVSDKEKRKALCRKECEKLNKLFVSIKESKVQSCCIGVSKDEFIAKSFKVEKKEGK